MRTEDYPRELIEQLLVTLFDRTFAWGMTNEKAPDPSMPRSTGQKNRGNTLWAHLADIRIAYDRTLLTRSQRQAVFLMGALGRSATESGQMLGVSRQSVQEAYDAGVSKLYAYLNGEQELPALELAA